MAIYPAGLHPLTFPDNRWVDPVTGFVIPKEIHENVEARIKMRAKCESSASYRRLVLHACRDSILFWVNLFVDTFKPLEVGETARMSSADVRDIPMITWPCQDPVLLTLKGGMSEGGDFVLDKSRNMGASYLCILPMLHDFLFSQKRLFKVISRTEPLVDNPGNPDSLFWKMDYIINRLPMWMRPKRHRGEMHLENLSSGSVIDGESTNRHVGRGGRRDAILIDEAAAIPHLNLLLNSTHMGVGCRIFNSTPIGPGVYSDLVFGGQAKVLVLPWWDHPEYGKGRGFVKDKHGNRVITSPFYEHEKAHKSPREIAQNLDRDHMAAGALFFDSGIISLQMSQAIEPEHVGTLQLLADDAVVDAAIRRENAMVCFQDDPKRGRWKLWLSLDQNGRPPQNRSYTIGADVAHGLGSGNKSSNSVLCVVDDNTGEQVAEYADPTIEPHALARLLMVAGLWFGGVRGCAYIAWERNGPGLTVEKHVRRCQYPRVYRQSTVRGQAESQTDAMGWHSNPESKQSLYREASDAMASDKLLVRSRECLTELGTIVFLTENRIGPGWMAQESDEAKATHADRVTAICVANHARRFSGQSRIVAPKPPKGSVARQIMEEQEMESSRQKW